ncbi:hypothetical protein BLS_009410 [Venturia inaequalis]|uniref:Cytochrome b-c1 complex subunit Rieske, mitochondrial n=1 Tax=Venturia inaequalis TaxID=5025 RepID=A0A8H3Z414_VENIN|nr:hypothetical protein BLS_009410 [Venturia inaequalis]
MSALTATAGTLARCARQQLPSTARAAVAVATQQRRNISEVTNTSSFDSPFKGMGGSETTKIPSFKKYRTSGGETGNKVFQYFMVGTMGAISALGAKATVQDFLVNMSASADVLAQAKVEVDLSTIPEGKNVIIKWRGKPVFIRHRTEGEIKDAEDTKWEALRDPQSDEQRVQKPEWLIMLGVCTHLGCVPIGEAGDFGGWFCPCHGSHYDISGRIRKGPAPLNLEIPAYSFPDDTNLALVAPLKKVSTSDFTTITRPRTFCSAPETMDEPSRKRRRGDSIVESVKDIVNEATALREELERVKVESERLSVENTRLQGDVSEMKKLDMIRGKELCDLKKEKKELEKCVSDRDIDLYEQGNLIEELQGKLEAFETEREGRSAVNMTETLRIIAPHPSQLVLDEETATFNTQTIGPSQNEPLSNKISSLDHVADASEIEEQILADRPSTDLAGLSHIFDGIHVAAPVPPTVVPTPIPAAIAPVLAPASLMIPTPEPVGAAARLTDWAPRGHQRIQLPIPNRRYTDSQRRYAPTMNGWWQPDFLNVGISPSDSSHAARIMETNLGTELPREERCIACVREDRACWVYDQNIFGHHMNVTAAGARCARCRVKAEAGGCSLTKGKPTARSMPRPPKSDGPGSMGNMR